jgi:signal transduction histidine kinase
MNEAFVVETLHDRRAARDRIAQLGRQETSQFIARLFRYRFFIVPLVLVILTAFAIWDPEPFKIVWVVGLLTALVALSVVEYWRVRQRQVTLSTLHINLALMILLQGGVIYITGGIESPMLPIFVPMCLAAGISAPSWRTGLGVAALPIGLTTFFAISCLTGLVPRSAPAFFELGSGWGSMPVYVWATAGMMIALGIATFLVASAIRRVIGTRVVELFEARQAAIESLTSRNRELLSVSQTIAHELKNPLASIQGLAQLLARSAEAGTRSAERFAVLQREIARMTEILDGFRNFSRPLVGLSLQQIDLGSIVSDVVTLHEGLAGQRGVELEMARSSVPIRCDPDKIKQALINLLQNALEASPTGGRVVVRLGPWGRAGGRVEIHDSGPGLSPQAREHLFEPGFSTKPDGSGIGLIVARTIAFQHAGSLTLENALSGGALASLCLPAEPPAQAPQVEGRAGE